MGKAAQALGLEPHLQESALNMPGTHRLLPNAGCYSCPREARTLVSLATNIYQAFCCVPGTLLGVGDGVVKTDVTAPAQSLQSGW